MARPLLARADVLALSCVHGVHPTILYPLLRGEPPVVERPQRLPFDADACDGGGSPPSEAAAGGGSEERPPDTQPATPNSNATLTLEALLMEAARPMDVASVIDHARRDVAAAERDARDQGFHLVAWGDAGYPPLLAHIFDPPLVLWVRGSLLALTRTIVAIVGSRAASPYGEQTAARLGAELASAGLVVASGMARGIDGAAHRGALAAGGDTVAVLGCGVDIAYPPEHATLSAEIARHGAVISEYAPRTPPAPFRFPARNRIISGLSRGVVVVEASNRSGALITADCALEQGREVMAVPGNVMSERHRGSHTLLKCGAALIESAVDVMHVLKMTSSPVGPAWQSPVEADPILRTLEGGEVYDLEELCGLRGETIEALLPRLLELELRGLVQRLPGSRFMRSGRSC